MMKRSISRDEWGYQMEKLKGLGAFFLVTVALIAAMSLVAAFFLGMGWLSSHLFPWFSKASLVAGSILFLVMLPLSVVRKLRPFTSAAILLISFVFGITLWIEGLLVTLSTWGTFAVIVGVLMGGIGVVPIGMLAALFHGLWDPLFELLILTVLTFGSRFFSQWLASSCGTRRSGPYLEGEI